MTTENIKENKINKNKTEILQTECESETNHSLQGARLLSREETQQQLLGLLDAFLEICKKHDLRYYLVGGTLLGAVRHSGFIPWDDDIDVGMPRPDYERFLELAKKEELGSNIRVVNGRDGTLGHPFAELLDTTTMLDKRTAKYLEGDSLVTNLFLDIFPQDGWPEDENEASRLFKEMDRKRKMVVWARAKAGEGTSALRAILKLPAVLICHAIGYKNIIRRMDDKARRLDYDSSKYVGATTYGIYGMGERCLRSEVIDFLTVDFCGRKCNAPGCADSYLRGIYGDDYMQLPPEEKRKTHEMKVWKMEE